MLRAVALAGVILTILVTLTACIEDHSPPAGPGVIGGAQGSNAASMPTAASTIAEAETIPGYEEVQRARAEIVGNQEEDISPEQWLRLQALEKQLTGKKIENWRGWVQVVSPHEESYENLKKDQLLITEFSVIIYLDTPTDLQSRMSGPRTGNRVDLDDIPYEQVKELIAWRDPITSTWEEVTFSGTTAYVQLGSNFRSALYDSSVEPVR